MKIGGFQSCTLADFPGRVAAILFFQGCNFRCPFCHNRRLIPPEGDTLIPAGDVLEQLRRRRGLIDGVVLCGGEPTLQPDLPAFAAGLRAMGLEIKLDTNGSRPEVLEAMLGAGLLDYVAMDVKAPWRLYARLAGTEPLLDEVRASVRVLAASGVAHEFRTTFVPGLLTAADLDEIRALLPPGALHRVNPYRKPPEE
ncbi:MAG: anaerobic ribonucleoside-triphosphate reductase activating protein [Acidobacteria bacterium]|nr:anaerobic ribonucleoside-triphosphate reductase activating protein [Acidobacteriota bacterium]